jgi:hypothetical protein
MSREYEYLNHANRLRSQASSCHCNHMGYLLPNDMETFPHQNDKTNRQWTPRHLFYLPLGITFYFEMRRRMSTMVML